jgi:hypothetical protein
MMIGVTVRAICVAALAALAAAVCSALAYAMQPPLRLEMDRDLPRNVSGVYPPEFVSGQTFAWTSGRAKVSLPGLDRRVPWTCAVRFRGGRSAPLPQPTVDLQVDGVTLGSQLATNELQDLSVTVPTTKGRAGLILTIAVSNPFVPGPADRRELGVQIDWLQCRPVAAAVALPPRRALAASMMAAAVFGAGLTLIGITTGSAVGAAVLLAAAQAVPISAGFAPYTIFVDRTVPLAFWIVLGMVSIVAAADRGSGQRLRQTARFVVAFSAGALYLKLLGQLHPSKPLVDALFQAHRLEWVMAGRYFFTQPMPGGVQFPYAIGLYVVAAPWAVLAHDHVALLRIVVCTAEAIAGALLYPLIVRTWSDRLDGAVATVLFSVVPISAVVISNANLTNAFGEAIALAAMAVVVMWAGERVSIARVVLWSALASLAFLSHVSTFAISLTTLLTLAVLYVLPIAPGLRAAGRALFLATFVAVAFATVTYYGHFGDVYRGALRVRQTAASNPATPSQPPTASATGAAPVTSLSARTLSAMRLTGESVGWPILLLALVGCWRVRREDIRNPLGLALVAWGIAFVVFLGVALMRVDVEYERYSLEFVGRVVYATSPAFVILAAHGAMWAWRENIPTRVASATLVAIALVTGVRNWMQW